VRRVLLTGGSGLIGAALLPALRAGGWTTRCLVHRSPVAGADETVAGDLRDPSSLPAAAAGVDAVLHLAAVTHARRREDYFGVNVEGTRNLVRALDTSRLPRLVLISSRTASAEGGHYGESKLRAEEIVRDSGLPFAVVRLPEVYGAGGSEGVDQIVSRAARGARIPLVGAGSQRICPLDLGDAIGPIVNAIDTEGALGKTYTLAGECLTVREFAAACIDASAAGSRIVGVPRVVVRALCQLSAVLPLPLAPDQLKRLEGPKHEGSTAAREQLGFHPRPLQEGLREHCRPST
jgi:2-alkyl-3-oxoalkanoate reductase